MPNMVLIVLSLQGVLPGVAKTLAMILKFVLIVALVILSFGYSYSYLALNIYGGNLLSSGEGAC